MKFYFLKSKDARIDQSRSTICFHLKYAVDFEKVINTANKEKNWEDFHGSPSMAFNASRVPSSHSCWTRHQAGWGTLVTSSHALGQPR